MREYTYAVRIDDEIDAALRRCAKEWGISIETMTDVAISRGLYRHIMDNVAEYEGIRQRQKEMGIEHGKK